MMFSKIPLFSSLPNQFLLLVCAVLISFPGSANAWQDPPGELDAELQELLGTGGGFATDEKVTFSASFTVDKSGKTGELKVTASVIPNWHIFSVTQPAGGPQRTLIRLESGYTGAKITGDFEPDSDWHAVEYDFYDVPGEEHSGVITWSAPIEFAGGVNPTEEQILVRIDSQVCEDGPAGSCIEYKEDLAATYTTDAPVATYEIRAEGSPVVVRGWATPHRLQSGQTVDLFVEIEPDDDWYIYDRGNFADAKTNPSLIVLTKKHDATVLEPVTEATPSVIGAGEKSQQIHREAVKWKIPIKLPRKMENKTYKFAGWIGYQAANDVAKADAQAIAFNFEVIVGTATTDAQIDLNFSIPDGADYARVNEIAQQDFESGHRNAGQFADYPIALVLCLAFVAGLILNVMPCVLPVIGLKVLSFVSQAGEDKRRVLFLNLAFAAGMLFVFMVLASLAVFFGVGWGGLFESNEFTIVMVAVIFAFGLSFFGVWEIPIPGFASSTSANKLAEKEGYNGAFVKGILTTLLATPCSGPLLIPAVTWALAQPAWLTYLTFFALGLGMAFPYVVIGIKPSLVSFLPKPGEWMETFKQLMGFLMMGTAVFFFNSITDKFELPTLAFLVFVGIACWIAGRIPFGAVFSSQAMGWAKAAAMIVFGAFVSYYLMIPQHELEWQPFSRQALSDTLAEGNTVFIDFTADW